MTVKVRRIRINALTTIDDAIEYNPTRTKLIITTNYWMTAANDYLVFYRPPWVGFNTTPLFPIWGSQAPALGMVQSGRYLYLDGEMSHGPWGIINQDAGNNFDFFYIEELKDGAPEETTDAPEIGEKEPEDKPRRRWGPFTW